MARGSDGRDRSQQIAAELREQIMSGTFKPGQALPSTSVLADRYSAAPATVSKAISLLKREGFARGQIGKAVLVRNKQPFVVAASAYKQPSPRGYKYELLRVGDVSPPSEVAEALKLGEGERVVVRQRLLLHEGDPVELSWSYYPLAVAAGTPLAGRAKIRGGAPQALADLGLPEREFSDRVSARAPLVEEVEMLDLPEGVPVIRQFRVVYSDLKQPVEASILIKGGHLHEVLYRQPVEMDDGEQ